MEFAADLISLLLAHPTYRTVVSIGKINVGMWYLMTNQMRTFPSSHNFICLFWAMMRFNRLETAGTIYGHLLI
jgi:hypothetical protein